jgi:threonine dehydrogenase-like Zn-dependent dehydrogenase
MAILDVRSFRLARSARMGQANCKRYMPRLLEHVRAGHIDAKAIITHRFPLEGVADAYDLFAQRRDGCIKCVLVLGGQSHG